MSTRWLFTAIGILALLAGGSLWLGQRASVPSAPAPVAAGVLYAATFRDAQGAPQPLGRYQGKLLVLNFWATWCAPCREEMPGFSRLQQRWAGRGVQFVGLSDEAPETVARFGQELSIAYPLWTGGAEVMDLSRRLGNRLGVLPHSALIGPSGALLDQKVGVYSEAELEARLSAFAPKMP